MSTNKRKPSNKCEICGEVFVVDSLARFCEQKHAGLVYKTAAEQLLEKKIAEEEAKKLESE
jgi:hypothetical protein